MKKQVKDILLPFYTDLCRFFEDIFSMGDVYRFVVLIARRCSNLAELFFRVLRGNDGGRFPSNFITDSAMLSMVSRLAETYRWSGRFPPILVVEDIVIYGKTVTAFLEDLEELLFRELEPDGYARDEIVAGLLRAVRIRAFARNSQPLLLASRYQPNFQVMKMMEPMQWRDLSNRISRLLLVNGQVNSSFVSGAKLARKDVPWPALREAGFFRAKTTYDAFPETLYCRAVSSTGGWSVIYTVRTFPSGVDGELVAAPFVFLPDMDEAQLDYVIQEVLFWLKPQLGFTPLDEGGSWEGCGRIKLEALTLILSLSLLQEFCSVSKNKPDYNGQIKLQMNYGTALNKEAETFIESLLAPSTRLLSVSQMDRLILNSFGMAHIRGQLFDNWLGDKEDCRGNDRLKWQIEDLIYETGINCYTQSYWQTQMYQEWEPKERAETSDYYATVSSLLEKLYDICRDEYPFVQALGWMFQMTDAGILSIAARSIAWNSQERAVVQCVKTGEQSQFIMPKRLREFIPVLLMQQQRARIMNRSFYDEFFKFAQINEDFYARRKELLRFLDDLNRSGQNLKDWDFDLVTLPDSSSENWLSEMKLALTAMQNQQHYMKQYIDMMRAE